MRTKTPSLQEVGGVFDYYDAVFESAGVLAPIDVTMTAMVRRRTSACSICGAEKICLYGGTWRCGACNRRRNREYYQNSALRRHNARRFHLRRRYGTTFEELERLLSEQHGCCAICRKAWAHCKPAKRARDQNLFLHHLCIDHDHERKTIRGLLCNACNTAIGLFEEDLDRFEAAMAYLRKAGASDMARHSFATGVAAATQRSDAG